MNIEAKFKVSESKNHIFRIEELASESFSEKKFSKHRDGFATIAAKARSLRLDIEELEELINECA